MSFASKRFASFVIRLLTFIKLPVEFVIIHQGNKVTINEHERPAGSCDESS